MKLTGAWMAVFTLVCASCVQGSAPEEVATMPWPTPPPTLEEMLADLTAGDVTHRRNAAKALSEIEPGDSDTLAMRNQIHAALTKAIQDSDDETADRAVLGFSRLRMGTEDTENLPPLLLHSNPKVAARALEALRISELHAFGEKDFTSVLQNSSTADPLEVVEAIENPSLVGNGYWLTKVIEWSRHPREEVRRSAVVMMIESGRPDILPALIPRMSDESPIVRLAAVTINHSQRPSVLIPALKIAEKDADAKVRAQAGESRKKLTASLDQQGWWPQSGPRFYDLTIGDLKLGAVSRAALVNPESTCFLWASRECDGAHNGLSVTSEPDLRGGIYSELVRMAIPLMKTGKGLALGDSRARVHEVLGKPTKSGQEEGRLVESYIWTKVGYTGEYVFEGDRLVKIGFRLDDPNSAC